MEDEPKESAKSKTLLKELDGGWMDEKLKMLSLMKQNAMQSCPNS